MLKGKQKSIITEALEEDKRLPLLLFRGFIQKDPEDKTRFVWRIEAGLPKGKPECYVHSIWSHGTKAKARMEMRKWAKRLQIAIFEVE